MNYEKITTYLQKHWYFVTLPIGVLILIGAVKNWKWLCDSTGKPHADRYTRGGRRVIFFILGIVLIVVSIWGFTMLYTV